ncbi:MAG: undecaprenyldiphospho-muramoylpentapeptide beta-N-acetylglucosaminyltransferase [Deltaproteobacteria bacterium]|nr:undecaprenyldiphospho-muramoylpentapeptide beta-N-acetylglucosaminyltransferase [Deltaproteobacteria bacterium]
MERIILASGGTGGHIFPAMAVAEEIRRRRAGALILFMGGLYGPEGDIAAKAGLDFVGLPVRGVLGRGGQGFRAAFGLLRGVGKALAIMRKFRPQAVLGFGGYAAFAGVLAGRLSGRITAIHEQNSLPGMSNRLLGRTARRIFLSMPDVNGVFPAARTVLVGNPVRADIAALYERVRPEGDSAARRPRLLVLGGSQGARALNRGMLAILPDLLEAGVEIWHQTGQAECEGVRGGYREAGAGRVRVEAFIADMARAYAWADLALCRAGGSSIAELTAAGLPAVLVPFPFAARDHQRYNARFLEQEGAGVLLEQERFFGPSGDPGVLARLILELFRDRAKLAGMGRCGKAAAKPRAAAQVVDELEDLLPPS